VVENDRISGVKSATDNLAIDRDEENGHLFVRPNSSEDKVAQMFVSTESGHTIGLRLNQKDIPAEVIKIKIAEPIAIVNSFSHQEIVIHLISAMHNQLSLNGYQVSREKETMDKIMGLPVKRTAQYLGNQWVGIEYEITNTTKESLELLESDFYSSGTRAISIENKNLMPSDITKVYVVRKL
jgi:type-F conjugative transfer system secretin TraK